MISSTRKNRRFYLFPNPPTGDEVDTDIDLSTANVCGNRILETNHSEPDHVCFDFIILESPEELQVSLARLDGFHWELSDLNDAITEDDDSAYEEYRPSAEELARFTTEQWVMAFKSVAQ